jgi:replication-associated recombination protein RarA
MGGFNLRTKRGYDWYEVVSSLQKEIRRGNEVNALYWAYELLPNFEFYFWSRLKVIVNEDIGIANPNLIVQVDVLSRQYFDLRHRGSMSCLLPLANAILLSCRSPKTRLADTFKIHVLQSIEQGTLKLEIPDYALDKHTKRGRAMKRSFNHFKTEGVKLQNAADIPDPYEESAFKLLESKVDVKWPALARREERSEAGPLFDGEENGKTEGKS